MIKDDIALLVREAVTAAMQAGALPDAPLPEITIDRNDRPRQAGHGDYSSSLPLRLQRALGGRPLEIAEKIRAHLPESPLIGAAEVAPPGFINFRLRDEWLTGQVDQILAAGEAFADSATGRGERVQVEFVSANPVGPLTVGNGRGAVFGSTLAAALEATGHWVSREYYINDTGTQIETFARTLYARYQQLFGRTVEIPTDGYPGDYVIRLAEALRGRHGDAFLRPEGTPPPPEIGRLGIEMMVDGIRLVLSGLGVSYDVWFSEQTLYEPGGRYDETMALLRERGFIAEKEGAVWFTSTDLGEDKDNVLVRSSGAPTYFASDIAYHYDKFVGRQFSRVIDVWGADHHGHISRLKAAATAVGVDPARLQILLYQLVNVRRNGEIVRLSKRMGEIIELRDLVEEVGVDACRFFFLQRSADVTLDFDIDLAKAQKNENPVYYVQYAHARLENILRTGAERGLTPDGADVRLLTHPVEMALIRKMLQLPEVLELVARTLEPHHLPYYATELATIINGDFYRDVRVVTEDEPLSRARLRLVAAARIALARTLHLMGMSAPESMAVRDDAAERRRVREGAC